MRVKNLARKLRKNQTDAERLLWFKLRNRQLAGAKFRRQHEIGYYIVDFVSIEKKVVVEVDGGQHNDESKMIKDNERTKYLEREGYHVLRFWNNEVFGNLEDVLEQIHEALTPTLSQKERESKKLFNTLRRRS